MNVKKTPVNPKVATAKNTIKKTPPVLKQKAATAKNAAKSKTEKTKSVPPTSLSTASKQKPSTTKQAKPTEKPVAPPTATKVVTKTTTIPQAPTSKNSKPVTTASKSNSPLRAPAKPTKPTPKKVSEKAAKRKKSTTGKDAKQFTREELQMFYRTMMDLRSRLTVQVSELREQSLLRHDEVNQDEDGTDAFERVTSLDRASVDQSQINQINTAIRSIEDGTYGLCEYCKEKIERPRLEALPFAKTCIKCQSEFESGSNRKRSSMDLLD